MPVETSDPARWTPATDLRTPSAPVLPLDATQQKQSPRSSAPVTTPILSLDSPRVRDSPPCRLGARFPPLDGVHLPSALAHVPRQPQELVVRPSRGVPDGASGKQVAAGLVGDLPPRAHVAHAGVPPVDPAVDGGLREPELRMNVDDLLGRDAAREAVPDDADLPLELPLALVHSEPGLARGRVRRPLGH